MIRKIDHIAIAVRSLDEALKTYEGALGLHDAGREEISEQKTRVAMLPVGESRIELLEATTADSPVSAFLAKRGEGLHHICLEVDDLEGELVRLRQAGVRIIEPAPQVGAEGRLIAFLHPSGAAGVLIELSQPQTGHSQKTTTE